MPEEMDARICLVTGATGSIGMATAQGLAHLGATVVLAARDQAKGEAVARTLRETSGNPNVHSQLGDLSSQASIRHLATEFRSRHQALHVLVNSAAVFKRRRELSADGLELMFATNHLGYFLLTNLLLEPLTAGAPATVINVTAPSTTRLDFEDLQGERRFRALWAFGASKMANLLFTFALARRLRGTGTTVNAYHPGIVRSHLMREAPAPLRWFTLLTAATPERAAAGVVELARTHAGGLTGRLFHGREPIDVPPYSQDEQVQERLWAESLRLTGLPA